MMKRLNIIKSSAIILVLVSLQSCYVAKEYTRPKNIVESQFYRTDKLPQDSLSMAAVSWKDLFTDPQLQSYIEEGLKNNIDIRIAIEQISIAEAYVKQGKAGFLPVINGDLSYTYQKSSGNGQFQGQFSSINQYQLSGGASWEADIWGKIRSNNRAIQASYLQTVAAQKAVASRLVANIASTYYQLLALDDQIRITEETIETRKTSLQTTKALKDAGNVTEVAVKQTEAQLYTAQGILVDLKSQERLLENTMSILLGSPMKAIPRGNLDDQKITTPLETGVPAQLLRNRPDVMAAEYNLINAFELTNVAKSNFYPSLTLSANAGLQSLEFSNFFSPASLFASLAGGLTQPILNGRKIRTQYEVSQAQQKQARLDFKYAVLNAGKEVSDALYSYESASDKIKIKENEFNAYNLATKYSEQLLDNGLANYLEVLVARENALNSSLDIVNAKYSKLRSVVELYEALGGGWR